MLRGGGGLGRVESVVGRRGRQAALRKAGLERATCDYIATRCFLVVMSKMTIVVGEGEGRAEEGEEEEAGAEGEICCIAILCSRPAKSEAGTMV